MRLHGALLCAKTATARMSPGILIRVKQAKGLRDGEEKLTVLITDANNGAPILTREYVGRSLGTDQANGEARYAVQSFLTNTFGLEEVAWVPEPPYLLMDVPGGSQPLDGYTRDELIAEVFEAFSTAIRQVMKVEVRRSE